MAMESRLPPLLGPLRANLQNSATGCFRLRGQYSCCSIVLSEIDVDPATTTIGVRLPSFFGACILALPLCFH